MTRARRAVLVAVAWLALVVVGSSLVWAVVSRAGVGVDAGGSVPVVATPSGSTAPRSPTPSGSPYAVPSPSAPSAPSPPTSPGSQPSSSQPSSAPPASPPAPQRGGWSGPGGTVVVTCTGDRIAFEGASADDGWNIEVKDRGPQRVRVELEERSGSERETHVEGRCTGGRAEFATGGED